MDDKKLELIREWLIENIFRDSDIMFSDAREAGEKEIDLLYVLASLYEELHKEVTGDSYQYMFHWANKAGSDVEDDLFEKIVKGEDPYKDNITCKHCEFCALFLNLCLLDESKCYENKKCLHENCKKFKPGKWCPQ